MKFNVLSFCVCFAFCSGFLVFPPIPSGTAEDLPPPVLSPKAARPLPRGIIPGQPTPTAPDIPSDLKAAILQVEADKSNLSGANTA